MLKRLYIDNFRCLSNFEIYPGTVSALIGPNGGGKSAVFDALLGIQTFLGPHGSTAAEVFPPFTVTRWDSRLTQKFEIDVELSGHLYRYSLSVQHDSEKKVATVAEQLSAGTETLYEFDRSEVRLYGDRPSANPRATFPSDPKRSFLPVLEARGDNQRITAFKTWIARMWLFKLRPDRFSADTQQEADALTTDGSNFVSWYRTLQQESPDIAARVTEDVRPVIPGLATMKMVRVGAEAKMLAFDCKVDGQPFTLALPDLSDGQKVLVALYTILRAVASQASLLVFDEPENFIADAEIQPWLSSLRDQVVEGGRGTLIVVSHHSNVIDYLAADEIWRIWRAGGPTRLERLDVDRSQGLSASEWVRLNGADG
ncbi:MAG TPA: AAA family ATPase [Polyangia bacterium]|nr:AAA family ATPase [Polyangia bacterium]